MSRRIVLFAAALAVLLPGLAACGSDGGSDASADTVAAASAGASVTKLSPADGQAFLAEQPEAIIVDVRTPAEFAEGHLPDAELIDLQGADFAGEIAELDKDATYVVYCRSGNRSGVATQMMVEAGFTSVYDLGGIVDLEAAGYEIVTG